MRKTKRFTALMMAALVAFGLVGCGGSTASTQPAGGDSTAAAGSGCRWQSCGKLTARRWYSVSEYLELHFRTELYVC